MKLELVGQADLLRHDGPLPADLANNMRVIPLKSSSSSTDPNISVALVVSSKYSTSVQITIASLTIRDGTLSATIDEKTYNDIPLPQSVKSLTGQNQEPGIILVDFKTNLSINTMSMVVEHIIPIARSEWQRHTFKDTFDSTTTSDAWSILTGNILSLPTQSTQLLALNSASPHYNFRLYAHSPTNKSFHLLSTHTCTSSSHTNSTFVHNHLTALLPSHPPAKPGLDVLDISLLKTNNPPANPAGNGYKLLFRTHRRTTSHRTAGTPNFVSHDECFECEIDDELAGERGYRSVVWLRTTAPGGFKTAILEIFTWYGGLGARLIAPPRRGRYGEYQLLGMRRLLEDGIGNRNDREGEGEGGEEVVSWAPNIDWVDSYTQKPI
ncbi:MAG: hypothetical protein L6R42_007970 [Xanthoria sp. 1 TBL-2021]|nr:MAG: hypothetical protein L6R42_007970 [Xanthoria sp. 1 TBL-2021]